MSELSQNNAVPAPAPQLPPACWQTTLLPGCHPRILGPADHLRALALKKPAVFRELHSQNTLIANAIVQAVEGLPSATIVRTIDQALARVAGGATNTHQDTWIWLQEVAFTFDFYHAQLSAEQRQNMIVWMNAHLEVFTDDENAFHNSTLSKILVYLQIAYATWNENPQAQVFRDHAIVKLYEGRIVPVLNTFGQGGGFTECGWYCRHSVLHLVQAMELARRVEGYDGFQKAPRFYYQRLAYELHQPYPVGTQGEDGLCQNYACEGDGAKHYSQNAEYPRVMRTLLAQYFSGSELTQHTLSLRRRGSRGDIRMYDFLHEEGAGEQGRGEHGEQLPELQNNFPLSHLACGIGKLFARSDWTADASWLRFECGPYWNQHQHFEAGNFEIFRRAPLATDSGEYVDWSSPHAVNWLVRTIAHNCILIHMPGEQWRYSRNGFRTGMANDGGQGHNTYVVQTLPEWLAKRQDFERGEIITYHNQPEFLVVTGDATKAYHPDKAVCVRRTILFLRPHLFVVLDRVVSTRPEYAKTWVLHCHAEPALAGGCFSVEHQGGTLHVQTLLPAAVETTKVHGYTYGGQTYNPLNNRLAEHADLWRVEVQPREDTRETMFAHVLSTDGPVSAEASVSDGVVRVTAGVWEVQWEASERGVVAGPGKRYSIERGMKLGPHEK